MSREKSTFWISSKSISYSSTKAMQRLPESCLDKCLIIVAGLQNIKKRIPPNADRFFIENSGFFQKIS